MPSRNAASAHHADTIIPHLPLCVSGTWAVPDPGPLFWDHPRSTTYGVQRSVLILRIVAARVFRKFILGVARTRQRGRLKYHSSKPRLTDHIDDIRRNGASTALPRAGNEATATPNEITTMAIHSMAEIASRVIASEHSAPSTGTSADRTPTVWLPMASVA